MGTSYNVINCGVGGENSQMIAARQGGLPLFLLNNTFIPTDGTEIGDSNDSGLRILDVDSSYYKCTPLRQGEGNSTINSCYIEDIECRIRWAGTAHNDVTVNIC